MPDAQLVTAVVELLNLLFQRLGVAGTITVFVLLLAYRLWGDHRRDKNYNRALDEKERSIQRLANQERQWRILFLKERSGLEEKEIEDLILRNDFQSPEEARQALEESPRRKKRKKRMDDDD